MLAEVIGDRVPQERVRWYAIKIFENDPQVMEKLAFSPAEQKQVTEILHTAEHIFEQHHCQRTI